MTCPDNLAQKGSFVATLSPFRSMSFWTWHWVLLCSFSFYMQLFFFFRTSLFNFFSALKLSFPVSSLWNSCFINPIFDRSTCFQFYVNVSFCLKWVSLIHSVSSTLDFNTFLNAICNIFCLSNLSCKFTFFFFFFSSFNNLV